MSGSQADVDSSNSGGDRAEESDSTYQKVNSPSRHKEEHQRKYELGTSNDTEDQQQPSQTSEDDNEEEDEEDNEEGSDSDSELTENDAIRQRLDSSHQSQVRSESDDSLNFLKTMQPPVKKQNDDIVRAVHRPTLDLSTSDSDS